MTHQNTLTSTSESVDVKPFYHQGSGSFSYVVSDPVTRRCAIIDCVLDFDYASGRISYQSADQLARYIKINDLSLDYLIETHVHADHLSAAPYLQQQLGGQLMIGRGITHVQEVFGKVFNEGTEFKRDGGQFDVLLDDGDEYRIGSVKAYAMSTPGHTPACMTHVIGDVAFVGDTLFMPDSGTARADFPGGDAHQLYRSIQRIVALPHDTKLYVCHDYQSQPDNLRCYSRVADQLATNIHVHRNVDESEFVLVRSAKDRSLSAPKLIYPALQVNMRAGELPQAENNGTAYLKVPLSCL